MEEEDGWLASLRALEKRLKSKERRFPVVLEVSPFDLFYCLFGMPFMLIMTSGIGTSETRIG